MPVMGAGDDVRGRVAESGCFFCFLIFMACICSFYSVLERGLDFVGWLVRRWSHSNDVDFPVISSWISVRLGCIRFLSEI